MTSIICWRNQEESDSVWAVSDSRVTGRNGRMTDNCPKLFDIEVKAYLKDDFHKTNPKILFSFGFGFAGSTLVGTNVKEMLSTFVSSLSELEFYDSPIPFKDKIPSLYDLAKLTKSIVEKYISFLAVCYTDNIGCEFTIFGYCPKNRQYRVFKLYNSPDSPLNVEIEEADVSNGKYLILGDKKDEISRLIIENQERFVENSLNWWRSPFIALASIIRGDKIYSIGGYLQFCVATPSRVRKFFLASDNEMKMVGFDLFAENAMLGGFLASPAVGMSMPGEDGWGI